MAKVELEYFHLMPMGVDGYRACGGAVACEAKSVQVTAGSSIYDDRPIVHGEGWR